MHLILISQLIFGISLILNRWFSRNLQRDFSHRLLYIITNSVFGMFNFACTLRFSIVFDPITLLYALVYAAICTATLFLDVTIYRYASINTINMVSGGGRFIATCMVSALLFGEAISTGGWLAILLSLAAICLPSVSALKDRSGLKGIYFCLLNILAGIAGTIFLKFYMTSSKTAPAEQLFFWVNVIMFILSGFVFMIYHRKTPIRKIPLFSKKQLGCIFVLIVLSNAGTLLGAYIVKLVPIWLNSVLSGALGLIISTAIARVLFKEKITFAVALSVILRIAAIFTSTLF